MLHGIKESASSYCSNNTGLSDATVGEFKQNVLKCIFDAMSENINGYDKFGVLILMTMGSGSPFFDWKFVKNLDIPEGFDDLNRSAEIYLNAYFDVVDAFCNNGMPRILEGNVYFAISIRGDDGSFVDDLSKAICREASKKLKKFIESDICFTDYRSNFDEKK